MLYLRTFGGLTIDAEPGGGPVPAPGPRRLALLAIVAAAGPRGITREKILGILWAERNEEQARHTLAQTLYLLRRETGAAWVTGTSRLRLDPPGSSDVRQFEQALESGRLEQAVELYTGSFLDGFYLSGTPEFEAWVEETRERLRSAALRALGLLARRAVDAGVHAEAARWWRRLCELDPFDAASAAGLIQALAAAGEPAVGLRVGREYEARVRRELETEPDPSIAALMAELRSLPAPEIPRAAEPDSARGALPRGVAAAGPAVEPALATVEPASGVLESRSWARRGGGLSVTVVAVLGLATALWQITRASRTETAPPLLAIGSIQPREPTLSGSMLRDMLATNLGRVTGLRVLANSRLVELLARGDEGTSAATSNAARRAGATEILEGELDEGPDALILTMRRVALSNGVVLQGYTVRAADLYSLTDSATAAIAGDFGLDPPPDAVATVRTGSAVAYALYEQGLRAYFHADFPAAMRLMAAALERDSAFAMAAAYAWRSNWDASRYEDATRLRPIVRRLASRTGDRERLWIEGMLAWAGAPLSEFLAIARELERRFPEDPDSQMLLGRALFSAGDWAGSVAAFDRAIAIDSVAGATSSSFCRVCRAIPEMTTTYMWWDSLPAAERSMRRLIAFRPEEEAGWAGLVESLLRQGRRADAEVAVAQVARLGTRSIDFDFYLDRDLIRSGRLEELETRLVFELRTAAPEARGEMPWLLGFTLRNQGRLRATRDLAAAGIVPGTPVRMDGYNDLGTVAIAALEDGRAQESARHFLELVARDRARVDEPGFMARNMAWHMTLAGTALAAAGDDAAVLALADSVERIGQASSIGRDARLHHFLRGLVMQRANRHAEAVDAFRRSLFSLTDGYTRINLELARSLVALGRDAEAIALLQPALRGGVDGGNTYVTHTELHEALARAFEAAGRTDSASVHWAAVERAWRGADAHFAERYRFALARSIPSR